MQTIQHGPLAGRIIRRARKALRCDGWDATGCPDIQPGEYYVEGDPDIDRAGGFGRKRYCRHCTGDALAAVNA